MLERLRAGGEGGAESEVVGWHHHLNGHESEQTPGDSEGQGRLACCSSWGHKVSDMTERLNKEYPECTSEPPGGFPAPRSPRTLLDWGHTLRTSEADQQTQAEVNKRTAPPKAQCDKAKIQGFAYFLKKCDFLPYTVIYQKFAIKILKGDTSCLGLEGTGNRRRQLTGTRFLSSMDVLKETAHICEYTKKH